MLTRSEEDHIKAVHTLLQDGATAGTKDLAERLNIKASSVTDRCRSARSANASWCIRHR